MDRTTAQGRVLVNGIKSGRTQYPNDFIRALNLAHFTMVYEGIEAREKALAYAIEACRLNPCQAAMQGIWMLAQFAPPLNGQILNFCQTHLQEFESNKDKYANMHGFQERLGAARIACRILLKHGQGKLDGNTLTGYSNQSDRYMAELARKHNVMRW
ncbi:MAG: hypothetical protein GY809_16920 [Planctomycetes bacterium]|nr:hypothetical protein [Planctomycetota bacterium]